VVRAGSGVVGCGGETIYGRRGGRAPKKGEGERQSEREEGLLVGGERGEGVGVVGDWGWGGKRGGGSWSKTGHLLGGKGEGCTMGVVRRGRRPLWVTKGREGPWYKSQVSWDCIPREAVLRKGNIKTPFDKNVFGGKTICLKAAIRGEKC